MTPCGERLQHQKKSNSFFLNKKQLHFGQSELESTSFATETLKQKFDWKASTEEAEGVLKGTYNSKEDTEWTKTMKLVLTNCVQISATKKTNLELTVTQLQEK